MSMSRTERFDGDDRCTMVPMRRQAIGPNKGGRRVPSLQLNEGAVLLAMAHLSPSPSPFGQVRLDEPKPDFGGRHLARGLERADDLIGADCSTGSPSK